MRERHHPAHEDDPQRNLPDHVPSVVQRMNDRYVPISCYRQEVVDRTRARQTDQDETEHAGAFVGAQVVQDVEGVVVRHEERHEDVAQR